MKIYISGPMSGYPELNFPAFNDAARVLKSKGYQVVNPAEFANNEWTLRENALEDIKQLVECDTLVLLPNWENSKGANAELAFAKWIGLNLYEYIGGQIHEFI